MSTHCYRFLLLASLITALVSAAEIQGTIIVKRKLTKRHVTASANLYQRGATVSPGADPPDEALNFERSHVAVYLEGPPAPKAGEAEMGQKDRRFTPDFVVVPVGSTVSFPNFDPVFHNVFSLSKPKSFDLGNYPKDHTRTVTFPKPGIVFVDCHLHPNMAGVIVVTPNQWGAKADANGQFRFTDVPPGTYTVVAWHKAVGFFRQTVRVSETAGATIQFLIPFDDEEIGKAVAKR